MLNVTMAQEKGFVDAEYTQGMKDSSGEYNPEDAEGEEQNNETEELYQSINDQKFEFVPVKAEPEDYEDEESAVYFNSDDEGEDNHFNVDDPEFQENILPAKDEVEEQVHFSKTSNDPLEDISSTRTGNGSDNLLKKLEKSEADEATAESNVTEPSFGSSRAKKDRKRAYRGSHVTICTEVIKCEQCGRIVVPGMKLCSHESREKPHACACGKSFLHKGDLKKHQRIHTGEKPFACTICDKRFVQSGQRKAHMMTHSGQKPYSCPVCRKMFAQKHNMLDHSKTHTGERPHACSICGKTFVQSCHLKEHIRTHIGDKPYTCSYCDKNFLHNRDLIIHTRVHTGEKPFSCPECNKRFALRIVLKRHLMIHRNEKPFACLMCDKSYVQRSRLNKHIRVHHGGTISVMKLSEVKWKLKNVLHKNIGFGVICEVRDILMYSNSECKSKKIAAWCPNLLVHLSHHVTPNKVSLGTNLFQVKEESLFIQYIKYVSYNSMQRILRELD